MAHIFGSKAPWFDITDDFGTGREEHAAYFARTSQPGRLDYGYPVPSVGGCPR
jgi:hypothetical protein